MLQNFLKIVSGASVILNKVSDRCKKNTQDFIEENLLNEKFVDQRDFNNLKKQFLDLKKEFTELQNHLKNKN
ncbi:MAG: hypothetical protein ISN64_02765 [Rickettsia sp.]|nr:hypothetical protein [Rickettsia sp.]